jgi:transposase-like protein
MTQENRETNRMNATLDVAELKTVLMEQKDFLQPVVQEAVQVILGLEMEECLQAGKYERIPERVSYRRGNYRRRLIMQVGALVLRVPQDQAGRFSAQVFEQYQPSELWLAALRRLDLPRGHHDQFAELDAHHFN